MTTTSDDAEYLLAENARLQREIIELGEVVQNLQKKLRKADSDMQQLRMTANVDADMVRGSVNRGTYANPAGGL